jgi:hypothetical protein
MNKILHVVHAKTYFTCRIINALLSRELKIVQVTMVALHFPNVWNVIKHIFYKVKYVLHERRQLSIV